MMTIARLVRIVSVVCLYLSWAGTAHADTVVDWNAIAIQVLAASPARPGPTAFLDSAMVQAAVYDAVEAIDRRFTPYHVRIRRASGSPDAAAAKAAHDVLINRFPDQTASLDTIYHDYLASHGLAEDDPGVAVGEKAAAGIIQLRADDGSFPVNPPPFTGGNDVGMWRPTPSFLPGPPPSLAPMAAPWLATVTPFTLRSPKQFRAPPPPSLTSRKYTRAYQEVKAFGELVSVARTPEQTDLALFWAANYLVVWNHALRDIAEAHIDKIGDSCPPLCLSQLGRSRCCNYRMGHQKALRFLASPHSHSGGGQRW